MGNNYKTLEDKIWMLLPGLEKALRLVLAVAISAKFQPHVMLWLLLVDVPSSGKTDLVRLIKDSEIAYYLDNLTPNAFISGERATKTNKVFDLLPELNNKCFIVKDWTSIFSMDEKATKKILGDLVNIYDGEFTKFSSTRGKISSESYFSHLGCITPATLNKHTQYLNMIGARFLFYKLPETSKENDALSQKRIFAGANRTDNEKAIRRYVNSYIQELLKQEWNIKPLSDDVEKFLGVSSNLISHCRGIVLLQANTFKNELGEEIKYYDVIDSQIEKQWRALHQLKVLSECLAFAIGKDEVGIEELEIIKEIVLASMPADRSQALRIIQEHNGTVTAKELSDDSERSNKTARRLLEELTALKVVEKIKGSGQIAADYQIVDEFKDFLCLSTTDFLSIYNRGTETPQDSQVEETNHEYEESK